MSRPQKNPAAAASVAQAPDGPYTSISDVERRVIENAGTGETLVHLDRKITDGLNLVHEKIRDLSKDIKDARSEHRADNAALRTESKGDIAELKDMIRALDAKVNAIAEASRELFGEVRAMRRLVWILVGIILGIGIVAALDPATANAAFNAIFGG